MDWFQSKAAQIIGLVSIIGTLAGFGYTGATYVNRIENLESKMSRYINEIDALADQVTELDKNVVAVGEQIKSLNVETQDLSPIKNDIVALERHGSLSIGHDIEKVYENIETLEYYINISLNSKD